MGLCLGKTAPSSSSSPWPDLPPDIAAVILSRLHCHGDRLSFGAVCHDWRLAERQQSMLPPPLAMPCINLGCGVYHSLGGGGDDDDEVRRFVTQGGYVAGASFGSWLINYEQNGSGRCFLHAPNNTAAIEVPSGLNIRRGVMIYGPLTTANTMDMGIDVKMVVCSARLVVSIFRRHLFRGDTATRSCSGGVSRCSNIACFRPAQKPRATWSPIFSFDDGDWYSFIDMTFYNGKIMALTTSEELFCYDFGNNNQQKMGGLLINFHFLEYRPAWSNNSYLVVSSDKQKLLMVRWNSRVTHDRQPAMDLQVFEADFGEGRWFEVRDLAGQVIFLGKNCSKAFTPGSLERCGCRFQGGNRVFVLGNEWEKSWRGPAVYESGTPYYCMYDMVSGQTSLVSLGTAHYMDSSRSGWFFHYK